MASTTATTELVAADDPENITDIQNYLQSFNKEIGEVGAGDGQSNSAGTTYYIDASQLADGAASGSNEEGATLNSGSATDGNGYQTLALLPNQSGGYVLIVQPQDGVTNLSIPEEEDATPVSSPIRGTRVKKEGEKNPNDISVYDFDDPAQAGNHEGDITNDPDGEYDDEEEEVDDEEDMRPKSAKKRVARTPVSSAKKAKMGTPSSPVSGSNQHMCNYCNYTSNKRYLLSRHMKSHSEERPHKCGICERGFKTIASLQNHVNTHTGVRPHGCKYCDAAFTTSGELVRHVRYRHTHEKPHRCTECDYASVELSKLKRHMRCHTGERPYQCPHCTYASPDTYKLKRHLRIHTGEKPYQCDQCQARFTQSNSLKAHRLIHSGEKPIFKCELCPTTCGRKTDLRIHVQKLHTSDKPMTCRRCDQSFPDRYTFKIHLKSHEGEKCFKCDLCNYASVSQRHLESHMLIHTDQKPFQCDECDQSFRQKQLLKRHKNLYHNPEYVPPQPKEKTHECPHCQKSFRHKGNLMRHLAIHDPDAYKDSNTTLRFNDDLTLIDDDDEEEEESEEEEMEESGLLDPSQTVSFTLDPQTQSMLTGDDGQVVVFEVVQMPGEEGQGDVGQTFEAVETPKRGFVAKSRSKGVRTALLSQSNGNSTSGENNIIIQLQTEDDEAANTITGNIIDESDFEPSRRINKSTSSSLPPPLPSHESTDVTKLAKQRDLAQCFGFKDDDDEDETIISLPASAAQ